MTIFNNDLTKERWFRLSFFEQMANLGSEVSRAIKWRSKDPERSRHAFESALELLDLTIEDTKNRSRTTTFRVKETRSATDPRAEGRTSITKTREAKRFTRGPA